MPGPLVDPDAVADRDDLDAIVDELFPEVEGGPGVFDVALVVAGIGLLGWAVATGQGRGWIAAAVVLIGLGVILPGRALLQRVQARRSGRSQHLPLDTSDASVRRLTDAYQRVLALAPRVGGDLAERSVAAAHRAVVETASLLGGRPPDVAAEREYADARAAAVAALLERLEADPALQRGDHSERAAIAQAKHELEVTSEVGSLRALDALTRELGERAAE